MLKKKKPNKIIDDEYQKLMQIWRPKFGNEDDISIYDYASRLMLKSNTADEIDSIKTKMIYLLKKRIGQMSKTDV